MAEKRIKGIVLQSTNYEENDKIVTIYSDKFGKLSFIAMGVNKPKSKNSYSVNNFCKSDFEIFKSRGLRTVSKLKTGVIDKTYFNISKSYNNYLLASCIISIMLQEDLFYKKDIRLFKSLDLALTNIDNNFNAFSNMIWFLFYVLKDLGGKWQLNNCYRCNKKSKIYRKFDFEDFGLVCPNCIRDNERAQDNSFIDYLITMNNNTFLTIQNKEINVSYEIVLSFYLMKYIVQELGVYSTSIREILKKPIYESESFQKYTHKVLTTSDYEG